MTIISKQQNSDLKFNLSFYGNGNILISSYDIESDTYSDFKPITEETFESLNKFFKKKLNLKKYFIKGMIPRNIHYFDTESLHVIWTTEEKQTEQLFTDSKIKNGTYPVPKLLWKFHKGNLDIFAYKIEKGKIVLYNAPFLNTSLGGGVCSGSIKYDFDTFDYLKIIQIIESKFYNSYFTHTNNDKLLKINLLEFYKTYLNAEKFPNNLLIKSNVSYDSLCS